MPRYGSETPFERDSRLIREGRGKKPNPNGGRNPFATPLKKAFDSNFKNQTKKA